MLRRLAGAGALLMLVGPAAIPAQAAGPSCSKYDDWGVCLIWASAGGSQGNNAVSRAKGKSGGGPSVAPNVVIGSQVCTPGGQASPQPPTSDPIWRGHTNGAIYLCFASNYRFGATSTLLFWAASPPAAAPPDPRQLAQRAISTMQLKAVDIGIVPEARPGSVGIIGMPTWMWADNPGAPTIGPITRVASAGGYTVTATAKVDRIAWTMGDGARVTCIGAGTPYADSFGKRSSPTCGHTYTKQGRYAVTATSYWTVNWTGIGQSGAIPLNFSRTANITMGEAQVLTQ